MLGVGLLATAWISFQVKQDSEQDAVGHFSFVCDQLTLKIQERLGACALVLRGGAGLFSATGKAVDRHAWRSYVETLRAQGTVSGVQGIGFSQVIAPSQLADHIAHVRGEGFFDYAVRPTGERAIYTSIIFLEPFRDRNLRAFGYDMYSEPVRREAMERARDTGGEALSGKVSLVQETSTEVQAGTLMYVPVYRNETPVDTAEQRREALIGWVYSPYRMNDLMSHIIDEWEAHFGKDMDMHVYAGTEVSSASLLFDMTPETTPKPDSLFYQQRTISFGGQHWLLTFDLPSKRPAVSYTSTWSSFIGGIALSGLLCGLMLSSINMQSHAVGIARDLTREIRLREDLIKDSEYRWRFALEGAGDGLWDWNVPEGTVFFSKCWKEMLGYAEEELSCSLDEWSNRIHPDDLAQALGATRAHFDGITPLYTCEYRIRCKDGTWKWILARGLVVSRDTAGKPLRAIGTHTDITSRKQRDEEQARTSERLALATKAGGVGIWDYDIVKNNLVWDDGMFRLYGISREQFSAAYEAWQAGVHPDDRLRGDAEIQMAIRGEKDFDTEFRVLWPDGSVRSIRALGTVRRDAFGNPVHMLGTNWDITAQKQIEEDLQKKSAELERFTYTVSHDLKSPLVTIKTFLGFLEKDMVAHQAERAAKDLGFINNAADKMGLLLEELLELARVGHNEHPPEEVSLQEIVHDALALVAGQISTRGVETVVTQKPVWLYGDRARLLEVFQNLVDNAVKFLGDQPAPRVEIGIEWVSREVEIFVRDNGQGIDPQHLDQVFGLFERLDSHAPGSGIGLALVRRIVELHGGKIRVESEGLGRGATFRFTLKKAHLKRECPIGSGRAFDHLAIKT